MAALVALPVVVVTVLGLPLAVQRSDEALRELAHTRASEARELAPAAVEALTHGERAGLRQRIAEYQDRTGARAHILDAQGQSVGGALCRLSPGELAQHKVVRAALEGQSTDSSDRQLSTFTQELIVAVPAIDHGTLVGIVVVCSALDDLELKQWTIWVVVAVIGALALATSGFLAEPLARWILRPVRYLEAAARRFAAGDHTARVPVHLGPPDLRVLAETFNHLAEQVQHQVTVQKSFVSDAAHQLRSPLVALRLRLENLEPHIEPDGSRGLEQALGEVDRMAGILNALLLLARSESGAQAAEAVDVLAVAEERVASWRLVAEPRGIALTIDGEGDLVASAAASTVDQILDVFLDNALRMAPAGTTVRVRVVEDGGMVAVQCIDAGPGMSPAERGRACGRFWRGAKVATGEGSGLGLAIAASLARANNGHVLLQEAPGGGLHAEVRLPAWGHLPSVALPSRRG
ncbi:HAMP domain-containing protein [Streptomyces sp. PKU-EA00015]|uniref:sensor histidine kinase n=1 Tax=Streptomyces sp. PKU-EA00015 TaxID=2748326 RepID=UPI0015A2D228|nr:HAMP domain-containing sensor histidine kinase [Streptomyces sp. PKU-EA00015]NWF30252.1 HAMP domain-containing protein [Streptomyces sp. PKU-EA00015]